MRGRVEEITEDGADQHIDKMAKKYMGVDKYPYRQPAEKRVMYKIKPEHTSEWDRPAFQSVRPRAYRLKQVLVDSGASGLQTEVCATSSVGNSLPVLSVMGIRTLSNNTRMAAC